MFQHTAARRRLDGKIQIEAKKDMFQHTAARRRLENRFIAAKSSIMFQHTAARRRLDALPAVGGAAGHVSTHSRPKAAGIRFGRPFLRLESFNTQPPEGGWQRQRAKGRRGRCFNTQPPEGGWRCSYWYWQANHGFNTQPPEGGWHGFNDGDFVLLVSTHSRPKAAGKLPVQVDVAYHVSTHSRPKAAGLNPIKLNY